MNKKSSFNLILGFITLLIAYFNLRKPIWKLLLIIKEKILIRKLIKKFD